MRTVVENSCELDSFDPDYVENYELDKKVDPNTAETGPAVAGDDVLHFVSEWNDSPLCALFHDEGVPFDPVSTTEPHNYKWQSTTRMALDYVPIDEASCDFESGKRLNQTVMSAVRHFFHTPRDCCFTLFIEPAKTICVPKLRAFPAMYRGLFSHVTTVFERTESVDEFRARHRGIVIFALDASVVRQAFSLVQRVVSLTLTSPISWWFRCERKRWLPVTSAEEAVVASSYEALQELMHEQGTMLRCIMVDAQLVLDDTLLSTLCAAAGRANVELLSLAGLADVTAVKVKKLLDASSHVVVALHVNDKDDAILRELAPQFADRLCALSVLVSSHVEAKGLYLRRMIDEATANSLVGTHMQTLYFRKTAYRHASLKRASTGK